VCRKNRLTPLLDGDACGANDDGARPPEHPALTRALVELAGGYGETPPQPAEHPDIQLEVKLVGEQTQGEEGQQNPEDQQGEASQRVKEHASLDFFGPLLCPLSFQRMEVVLVVSLM